MKKFILGFVIGSLLFSTLPTLANISDYILHQSETKVTIDGTEYANQDLPVLYLDPGYNYLPAATFRDICANLGVKFEWNGESKTIELTTPNNEKPKYVTYNGYEAIDQDGIIYIAINSINYFSLSLQYDDETLTLSNKNGESIKFDKTDTDYCIIYKYRTYIKLSIMESLSN